MVLRNAVKRSPSGRKRVEIKPYNEADDSLNEDEPIVMPAEATSYLIKYLQQQGKTTNQTRRKIKEKDTSPLEESRMSQLEEKLSHLEQNTKFVAIVGRFCWDLRVSTSKCLFENTYKINTYF